MHQRHCLDSLIGSRCSHTSFIGSRKWPHIFSMIQTTSFGGSCNQKAQRIRNLITHQTQRQKTKHHNVSFPQWSWHKALSCHPFLALPDPYPRIATRFGQLKVWWFHKWIGTWHQTLHPKQTQSHIWSKLDSSASPSTLQIHIIDTIHTIDPNQPMWLGNMSS